MNLVISSSCSVDYFGQSFLISSSLRASPNLNTIASEASWICPSWHASWSTLHWTASLRKLCYWDASLLVNKKMPGTILSNMSTGIFWLLSCYQTLLLLKILPWYFNADIYVKATFWECTLTYPKFYTGPGNSFSEY